MSLNLKRLDTCVNLPQPWRGSQIAVGIKPVIDTRHLLLADDIPMKSNSSRLSRSCNGPILALWKSKRVYARPPISQILLEVAKLKLRG